MSSRSAYYERRDNFNDADSSVAVAIERVLVLMSDNSTRELSLVLTNLEQAQMWLHRAYFTE